MFLLGLVCTATLHPRRHSHSRDWQQRVLADGLRVDAQDEGLLDWDGRERLFEQKHGHGQLQLVVPVHTVGNVCKRGAELAPT